MTLRIKNWSKHQHFKDRTPPWIKLYREILDDPDWHELDGDTVKVLIGLWLIASEDETHNGTLPCERKLAFRLRIKESQLKQALTKLSHWLIQEDINVISDGYQPDAPERAGEETEGETDKETEVEKETDKPRKRVTSFDVKQIELPDWLPPSAWALWCDSRSEQKKPIGKLAATQQIEKLAAYMAQGHSPESVIKHSVAGSFQGLYPPNKPASSSNDSSSYEWFETKGGVEKKGIDVGVGKWDQLAESWPQYKTRVMQAEKDSRLQPMSLFQLSAMAKQRQVVAA